MMCTSHQRCAMTRAAEEAKRAIATAKLLNRNWIYYIFWYPSIRMVGKCSPQHALPSQMPCRIRIVRVKVPAMQSVCNSHKIPQTLSRPTNKAGEKTGQSASNAIWLDAKRTTSFSPHQFFIRTEDDNVERVLFRWKKLMKLWSNDVKQQTSKSNLIYLFDVSGQFLFHYC